MADVDGVGVLSELDRSALRRLVEPRTFARASAYARSGAVRSRTWSDGATRAVGEVQGGAAAPYSTSAVLTRSTTGSILSWSGDCSCPVGVNCKHAAALLLATKAPRAFDAAAVATASVPTRATAAGSRPSTNGVRAAHETASSWETALQGLLVDSTVAGAQAGVGLFVEWVESGPHQGRSGGVPGIRLRPIVSTRSGGWSTTEMTWSNLDYHRRGSDPSARVAMNLLREVVAISRLSGSDPTSRYRYNEEVWLDQIGSRQIWGLWRDLREAHVPVLSSVRPPTPVVVEDARARVSLDLTRHDLALRLEARVEVGSDRVPTSKVRLLGLPAHGIAWWDGAVDDDATLGPSRLHLAPFDGVVDETFRELLGGNALSVPAEDEERFVHEFVPLLQARVATGSSDGSVNVPDLAPVELVVMVSHERDLVPLAWARARPGVSWRSALGESHWFPHGPEADQAVRLVTEILAAVPGLVVNDPDGPRLAPTAELGGIAAVRFIAEFLPLLNDVPGVVVEVAGDLPRFVESTDAPVVRLGGEATRDGDWFDLAVEVSIGGEVVPFQLLFTALAEERSHLVLPSGTYFSLDRDDLRQLHQAILEARTLHDAPDSTVRLSRFQAGTWEDLCGIAVVTEQASAWNDSVRALLDAADRVDHPAPPALAATLRPYQLAGFNWLAYLHEHRLGGVLADDMGLGKTVQALALICHVQTARAGVGGPFLVIAPTSVVGNWASECHRFAPGLRVVTVSETGRRRGVPLLDVVGAADIVITSYALLRLDYDDYEAVAWAGLFIDEAQFAKNRLSKTYQLIKKLPVSFKVAMTGTPMENNLMELWSILSITAPGLFASHHNFESYYRTPIERHRDTDRLALLRRRLRPLMLRRTKEQVIAELPAKQEQVLELELNAKQHKLYQTYLARERRKVLGLVEDVRKNRFEILKSLTVLRQASLAMSLVDEKHVAVPSTKLDALMGMVEDIVADGHRVLVFSQFTRFLSQARQRVEAAGVDYCYLDGRTRKRAAVIDAFRTGDAPVFFISLKAGGFGLNLTEADYVILLDPWWNPATEAQAVDRVHRIGQTRQVMVYRLVASDTIEEKVMALKEKKSALFSSVIDAGGFETGVLTADEIRDLVS